MAITWRNVQGNRGFTDAGLLMRSANQSFQDASKTLNGVLERNTEIDDHNYEQVKENNTDEYLNLLQSYGSPEELQKAKDSGELEAKLKSLGPQINQDEVRGADTDQLTKLRTEANATTAFEKNKLMEQANPIVQEIKALEIAGDPASLAKADQLRDEHSELLSSTGQLADVAAFGQQQEDAALARQRAATQEARSKYAFDQGVKNDLLQEEARLEKLEVFTAINDGAMSYRKEEADRAINLQRLASDSGVPLDENNQPLWDQAPDEALAKYADEVKRAGLESTQSYTQRLTSITDNILAKNPDIDPALLQQARAAAEADQLSRNTLSAADELEKSNLKQTALANSQAANTAFYQEEGFAKTAVTDMVSEWAKTVDDGDLVDQVVPMVNQWVESGIDIGDGQKVKLVPSQVQSALTLIQDKWGEIDNNPAEAIKLIVNQPGFKESAQAYLDYKAEAQIIDLNFDNAAKATKSQRLLGSLYNELDGRRSRAIQEEQARQAEAERRANDANSGRKSDQYLMDLKAQADAQGTVLTGAMLSQYRSMQRRNN